MKNLTGREEADPAGGNRRCRDVQINEQRREYACRARGGGDFRKEGWGHSWKGEPVP